MLPARHCLRLIPPLMSGPTIPQAASRFFRTTAVSRNVRATLSASAEAGTFVLVGLVLCDGPDFRVETWTGAALLVPRLRKTPRKTATPISSTAALIHSSRCCMRGEERKPLVDGVVEDI